MSASTSAQAARATASFWSWNRPATPPPNRGCCRPTSPTAASRSSASAKTSTSIPSITATACGSSAPTIAAATSASSPRPSPPPAAITGPSSFAHRDDVMLEDVDLFAGFFVACEREDGLPRLRLWTFDGDGPRSRTRRRNRLSLSRPTTPTRTSTASLRPQPSATATSRWSRPIPSTNTTWQPAPPRF